MKVKIILVAILCLAAFFRLYGVNWDTNQHLHPDERFLTMVTSAIAFPANIGEYLDTSISPLNPHNKGFNFFVYGTFPIFFTKWVSEYLGKTDYNNLTLIGRQLSALFDLGTVILVFLIARNINPKSEARNMKQYQNTNDKNSKPSQTWSKPSQTWSKRLKHLDFENLSLFRYSNLGFRIFPLISMFFYAASVLPIQLSHFYAVDTYLTFFTALSFYLLVKVLVHHEEKNANRNTTILYSNVVLYRFLLTALLGVAFGLALASKISAIFFLPIIIIGLTVYSTRYSILVRQLILILILIISAYFTFRLAQPYLFVSPNVFDITLNPKVLDNWKQLKSFDDVSGGFPPSVQWITTKPYLFPLKNMVLWGLGLPLGIIALLAVTYHVLCITYYVFKKKIYLILHTKYLILSLSLVWIFLLFIYQGGQFVKALRYFYPIYPFLTILSAYFIYRLFEKYKIGLLGYWLIGLLVLIYPLSFLSIYTLPHSRIAASEWIYQNIPAGSTLSAEHWDDGLPLSLPEEGYIHEKYKTVEFPLYYPDEKEKWELMAQKLAQVDYIIMSSNRLYGSTATFLQKYPVTNRYYWQLFDGSLGFEKVAEFTSRPNIPLPFIKLCIAPPFARYGIVAKSSQGCPLPGISFVDDYADETFTVYDHPKVLIFKKVRPVDYLSILYETK